MMSHRVRRLRLVDDNKPPTSEGRKYRTEGVVPITSISLRRVAEILLERRATEVVGVEMAGIKLAPDGIAD
jgi:hypothetical protein